MNFLIDSLRIYIHAMVTTVSYTLGIDRNTMLRKSMKLGEDKYKWNNKDTVSWTW